MKNSNDTSWDRTSDLPICSMAPEGKGIFTIYLTRRVNEDM